MSRDGTLRYNQGFVDEWVKGPPDLFCLVMHETLHQMFGHLIGDIDDLKNFAGDAAINFSITASFPDQSDQGSLFRSFYSDRGVVGLLRPGSLMNGSRYQGLYYGIGYPDLNAAYGSPSKKDTMTSGEIERALLILSPDVKKVILLGDHGKSGDSLPKEALSRIAKEILEAAQKNGDEAGHSDELEKIFFEVLRSKISLRESIFDEFVTKRKLDRFKERETVRIRCSSVVPLAPSRMDILSMACGVPKLLYHNRISSMRIGTARAGLAMYVDVSGSFIDEAPRIVSLIRKMKRSAKTVYVFSNKVVEAELVKFGASFKARSTYGTDFDCVAEHAFQERFDRLVIFSDGFASISDENIERIKDEGIRILFVLFGKGGCKQRMLDELKRFSDVVSLDDAVQGGKYRASSGSTSGGDDDL
jgi:hypothetical protein